MEHIPNSILAAFDPVQIHVLGVDRAPLAATVITRPSEDRPGERSGVSLDGEVHFRLEESPRPSSLQPSAQRSLQPGLAVRIETPEAVLLGEIAATQAGEESGQTVAVVIREQFLHLTDLGRMHLALAGASDAEPRDPAAEPKAPESREFWDLLRNSKRPARERRD